MYNVWWWLYFKETQTFPKENPFSIINYRTASVATYLYAKKKRTDRLIFSVVHSIRYENDELYHGFNWAIFVNP